MSDATDLITEVPEEFVREFREHLCGNIPLEKAQVELRQARNARIMQAAGSVQLAESLGQKVASIDPRLFFRMRHAFGHEENWLDDLIFDNAQLRAPGYNPGRRKSDFRRGKTFINGKPV